MADHRSGRLFNLNTNWIHRAISEDAFRTELIADPNWGTLTVS